MTTESRMREALEKLVAWVDAMNLHEIAPVDAAREALSPPARRTSEEDRVRALKSLVRAADRMREGGSAALDMTKEWHGGLCSCRKCKVRDELGLSINDYDTQRAAVGEIGEE